MDWGMRNRLAKIIKPDTGRSVMLAVDHGYFMGPTARLEVPRATIAPLLPFADSLMLTRGILRTSVAPGGIPVVLRVSGGTSMLVEDLSGEGVTTTMKEALRLDAAAVALSIFIGAPHERQSLLNLGSLVSEAEEYGMPVLAVTAVGKELEKRDARYLALACRIAAELGARAVKTYYCDDFEKVVEGCPVPLVVAGGPKLAAERDVFRLAHEAVRKGAVGVDMGRNIWQHDAPVAMIKAIRQIVHHGASPDDALALFQQIRAEAMRPAGRR
jgi:putative autoinducer-2 (AI-2) aldolase